MTDPARPLRKDPVSPRPSPEQADAARAILRAARHAALSYVNPETGGPAISRIALGLDDDGRPVTLMSDLSAHAAGLRAAADCAFMVGEPGARGDPLTHPRLMVTARAAFVAPDDPARAALRARWLADHPKSLLYIDFADFAFVRLTPLGALWNGGFGQAARFLPEDLLDPAPPA